MSEPGEARRGRFAAIRGKIAPGALERFSGGEPDGTVGDAQGSAEGVGRVDERDHASLPEGTHELSSEVSERVRSVISAAEAAANAVRHEAEQSAQVRGRIAEEEAIRIVDEAKGEADAYLAERRRRISELSDTVVERAEKIVARLDRAEEVRRQLQGLADSLGESAEELAAQLRDQPPPSVPQAAEAAPPVEQAAVAEPEAPEAPPGEEPPTGESEPPGGPEVVQLAEAPAEAGPAEAQAGDDRHEADEQLSARLVALQMAVAGGNRGDVEVHLRETFGIEDPVAILDDVFGPGTDAEKRVAWPRTGDSAA